MAETTYTYTIATDFAGAKVNPGELDKEIRTSAITIALKHILVTAGTCKVVFNDALPAADKTILDNDTTGPAGGLIGSHTAPVSKSVDLVQLSSPSDGGKPVMVPSPSTEGWMTWFCGAGDDLAPQAPASGRGEGTRLRVSIPDSPPTTVPVDLQFSEPIELHDGEMFYTPTANWSMDDVFSLSVIMPATVATVNGTTTGNCNLVDVGGYNRIEPANGDGTHDVDLANAVVVPSLGTGHWDADHNTGTVTASGTPGTADWSLFDVQIESFFLKKMPMGHPLGTFQIDTYKAEWIPPSWKLRLEVTKNSAGAGEVTGWLMLFRAKST